MKGKKKNMIDVRNILHRLRLGQSTRCIHKELKIYRPLISKLEKVAIAHNWLDPASVIPSDEEIAKVWHTGKKTKRPHQLDHHKEKLKEWIKAGNSFVVIQRLLKDQNFPYDVQAIRRYCNKHFLKRIEPVMVRPTFAGQHMDLDFGELGRFVDENQVIRKVWLLSLRFRHSRMAFRQVVVDQTSLTFLMGHVHAFEKFGGVPKFSVFDNTKAAVIKYTIDNEMMNPSYQALAEHYKFVLCPCLPGTPEHKGGIENDVKYVKKNFLPYFLEKQKEMGIKTPKICDLIEALEKWEKEIADVRPIQGVGRSPIEIFKSEEEKALLPLPKDRWDPVLWAQCTVTKEWRIMFESAYYSVPYNLIGEKVDVCITSSLVRIFHRFKEVALHERAREKWAYQRKTEHAPPFHEAVLQCNTEGLLSLAKDIGPFTHQIAQAILAHPSIDKLRPVRCMLRLAEKYSHQRMEKACQRAVACQLFAYRNIRNILENGLDSQPIDSVEAPTSKVIPLYKFARDAADYNTNYKRQETFEEKLNRLHPYSRHGNGMYRPSIRVLGDNLIDQVLQDEADKAALQAKATDEEGKGI